MSTPIVVRFLPRQMAGAEVVAWSKVFSAGQSELSGSSSQAAALAERLLAEDEPATLRWAARGSPGGPVVGAAELRPQPQESGVGFLRLFVAAQARRDGIGSALLAEVFRGARDAGLDRIRSTVLAGPPGEPFARSRRGMRVLLRLVRQEQRLDDERVLGRCRQLAVCPDPGYRLVRWRGPAPEPLVASFGRVMGHVLDPTNDVDPAVWLDQSSAYSTIEAAAAAVCQASNVATAATTTMTSRLTVRMLGLP